jgi:hypothetical protein
MSFGGVVLRAGRRAGGLAFRPLDPSPLLPQGPLSLLVWPLQISIVFRQRQGLAVSEVAPRLRLGEFSQRLGEEAATGTHGELAGLGHR